MRTIARSAKLAATAGVGAALLMAAGCGGGSGGVSNLTALAADQVLAKVGETSAATNSASFAFEISGTGEFAIEAQGTGKYTTEPEYAAEFSMSDVEAAGQSLPGGMDMRMIGTVMYMRMPALNEALGAEWIKVDLSTVGEANGFDFEALMQQQQLADPRAQLEMLVKSGDIVEVGEEEIDGADTVHYQGTVDMAKLAESQDLDEDALKFVEQAYDQLGISSMPYEMWVDNDFHVRKLTMTMQGDVASMEITMSMTDFGKPVTVEAPSDALDISSYIEGGSGG